MRTIALCQVYLEEGFVLRALRWIYPLVDQIVITENWLSPFPKPPPDDTGKFIRRFISRYDEKEKIKLLPPCDISSARSREEAEGINKRYMLKHADIEDGDLIFILDVDEFYDPDYFLYIKEQFKKNDKLMHAVITEWQFAYSLDFAFKASHEGRFMRYKKGATFGNTNHFFVDGKDITKDRSVVFNERRVYHLCWVKHPDLIKLKVLSFNRLNLTMWFNNCYLVYPRDPQLAYQNNQKLPQYRGKGFAEGQDAPLERYRGRLPVELCDFDQNYYQVIKEWGHTWRIQ